MSSCSALLETNSKKHHGSFRAAAPAQIPAAVGIMAGSHDGPHRETLGFQVSYHVLEGEDNSADSSGQDSCSACSGSWSCAG